MCKTRSCSIGSIIFFIVVYMFPISGHEKQSDWIYILLWTFTPDNSWFYRDLELGREAFTSRNCTFQNCFIVKNRTYFSNVIDYDVLIFNAFHISRIPFKSYEMPESRTKFQQYVLASADPAAYNTINANYNAVFNVTWTYKLNSDIVSPYFLIKNKIEEIIGPKIDIPWINITDLPVNRSVIEKLKNKTIAALWVASTCSARSRIDYVLKLKKELKKKYGLQLDVFGKCGNRTACKMPSTYSRDYLTNCYDKVESDYYFYLAFERSLSEDYITESVLHGLNHFTVPIVYSGADYNRFMPDGIYLDAIKLGVEGLAKEMHDIIKDPPRYYDFFKWHGYYTFHDTSADNHTYTVCELCAFFNNKKLQHDETGRVFDNVVGWWNVASTKNVPLFETVTSTTTEAPKNQEVQVQPSKSLFSNLLDFLTDD